MRLALFAGLVGASAWIGCEPVGDEVTLWTSAPPARVTPAEYSILTRDSTGARADSTRRARAGASRYVSIAVPASGDAQWLAATWAATEAPPATTAADPPRFGALEDGLSRGTHHRIEILPANSDGSRPVAWIHGWNPSLERVRDGGLVLVHTIAAPESGVQIVLRHGDARARAWSDVHVLANDARLNAGRLVRTPDGAFVIPLVRPAGVACLTSTDDGRTWRETALLHFAGVSDAVLAPVSDAHWMIVMRREGAFARSISDDAGRTWTEPAPLEQLPAAAASLALARDAGRVVFAWTDAGPDTTVALPAMQALRASVTQDRGATWTPPRLLALRPGRVPLAPALVVRGSRLGAAFVEASGPRTTTETLDVTGRIVGMSYDFEALHAPTTSSDDSDRRAAVDALRLLCAHTLQRPPAARKLFVEGYFARGLAAAARVLAEPGNQVEWFDPQEASAFAERFAAQLVAHQDETGYWSLGYGAIFLADMGATLGLFTTLDVLPRGLAGPEPGPRLPTYPPATLARIDAARRFVAAMEQDGMLLANGAVGIGWPGSFVPRVRQRASHAPYLVSTALAGIETCAWLWMRTGEEVFRTRALEALNYTLAQLGPDGALTVTPGRDGPFATAAYVQEGWIAADVMLADPARLRLQAALPPHVDWLLRTQRTDGTWDSGADGEFARTPAILNFLMWYDERFGARPDVRAAIRRASRVLLSPDEWYAHGLTRAGNHHDVQRTHSLRALVALASGHFTL